MLCAKAAPLGCNANIRFQGQLFSGVDKYYDPETANFGGIFGPQKTGPIPLGNECGAAGLSSSASCPEGGLATNGDNLTQASQAQGQIWAATSTQIAQTYTRANAIGTCDGTRDGFANWGTSVNFVVP
jgi:hypothetical protein